MVLERGSRRKNQKQQPLEGLLMSAIRRVTLSIAALLLGLTAMFSSAFVTSTGVASADCPWGSSTPC